MYYVLVGSTYKPESTLIVVSYIRVGLGLVNQL